MSKVNTKEEQLKKLDRIYLLVTGIYEVEDDFSTKKAMLRRADELLLDVTNSLREIKN